MEVPGVPFVRVKLGGEKVQTALAGSDVCRQESVTGLVVFDAGVTVIIAVADCPEVMVRPVVSVATVKSGMLTVMNSWLKGAEAEYVESPLK
jgi:hypothetical protein